MRTFEGLLFVLLVPDVLFSFADRPRGWLVLLTVSAAVVVMPLHAWIEGMHWQKWPAYAAIPLLLLSQSFLFSSEIGRSICAILAGFLLFVSCALTWALPMFKLPKPTGQYPVGTTMLYLVDTSRKEMHMGSFPGDREVIVQLWYPASTHKGRKAKYRKKSETTFKSSYQAVLDAHYLQDPPCAAGAFPVTLYNPAWHGSRHRGTFTIQELASQGFVVAAISHPYNSSHVELSNGKIAHPDYDEDLGFSLKRYIPLDARFAMADRELAIQTRDCSCLLDELERMNQTPGHLLQGHLRIDRIGAYGYSFGGAVSVEFAREEPRVRSALGLDGVLHGDSIKLGLQKPLMLIDSKWMVDPYENVDNDPRVSETAKMWNSIAEAKGGTLSRYGGMRVVIEGIGHVDFTDQIHMSPFRWLSRAGSLPPARVARILNEYIVAFFRQTLCDEQQFILEEGSKPFPEATLTVWPREEM
jgi:dienelactone hydrolase